MINIKNIFSIGEVSKLKDITIKTLRYYHKVGILIPKYIDESSGYRYYTIDQFVHIDIIKGCRELGTSISELQEIFKECNTDKLLEFLQVKRQQAKDNILKMENIVKNIDVLSSTINNSKEMIKESGIKIKYFNKRYIVAVKCEEVGDLNELIYYSDLDKIINNNDIEVSLERGIIYKLNLLGESKPQYVFDVVKDIEKVKDKKNIKILPSGEYVTLIYNKENMDEKRKELISYINKNDIKVENIIETEIFNDIFSTEDFNCQIQILIKEC